MSSATLTLIGLNNFLDTRNIDLFEKLSFPDGIDKETAIQNILLMCDEKELLYPNPDFMIEAIGLWSKKWNRTFTKWIKALNIEYNPLENYDRQESWSDSTSSSESNSASASDSSYGSNSMLNDVSAFNSDYLRNDSASKNDARNNASSSSKANNLKAELSKHEGRVHGNIGVTTSQQMLQSEIDLRNNYNFVDNIMNDVDSIMCLLVY